MASGSYGPTAIANQVGFPVSWYWKGYVRAGRSHTHFSRMPGHGALVVVALNEWGAWNVVNVSVLGMAGGTRCTCSGRTREGMREERGGGGDGVAEIVIKAKSGEVDWDMGGPDKALAVERVVVCCVVAACASCSVVARRQRCPS